MPSPVVSNERPVSTSGCCGGATSWIPHDDAADLAQHVASIADPIRLQIVSILANAPDGEVCACDFVDPLGRSQPTISHHLRVLTEAGVIDGDKRGRWVWYRLNDDGFGSLIAALQTLTQSTPAP